ncbi:MAG: histidine utilization repressor [Pseudomonadota bacterium]
MVKNYILEHIESGAWPPDSRAPSENQLVKILGVSRMTANRALRELTGEGRLVRIQGVGTFVTQRKPQAALLEIRSISDEIAQWGGVHDADVHLLAEEKAPPDQARALGLEPGAQVYHSIIVHKDNGRPVQLSDRFVNPAAAPGYLDQDFTVITPNQYLQKTAPLDEAEHVIEAISPDKFTRKLLEIQVGEPCLLLRRRTWSQGVAVTCSRLIYPGSRYRLGGRFRAPQPTWPR